jgi:hypothetical protein
MIDYLEQDICDRCETVFVVGKPHACTLRRAIRALRRRQAEGKLTTAYTGPMIVGPVNGGGE